LPARFGLILFSCGFGLIPFSFWFDFGLIPLSSEAARLKEELKAATEHLA